MRIAFGVLVVLAVLGGLAWYAHRRATFALQLGPRGRRAFAAVLALGIGAIVLGRIGARVPWLEPVSTPLGLAGAIVTMALFLAFPLLVGVDALRLLAHTAWKPAPDAPDEPDRRTFLARSAHGVALAAGGGVASYGTLFGRHDYAIEEVEVRLAKLPREFEGLTIVQLSDIHFGAFVGDAERRSAEALVRRAHPDLVVLTGDLVDHDATYAESVGKLVRNVSPLARFGVAVIPGNHDYYAGAEAVMAAACKAGGHVLENASVVLRDGRATVGLVGVDDLWAERLGPMHGPDLAKATAGIPEDAPKLLLCHNPAFFPDAAGHVDLQLSGHTHGGQISLGWNPAEHMLPFGYVAGLYHRGAAQLYVNRGFGTAGPPSRIGVPPEVTRVVLVRG
ncbi:MAG: metallophosphoesterase [Polyangiales bacterium]